MGAALYVHVDRRDALRALMLGAAWAGDRFLFAIDIYLDGLAPH